MSKHNMRIFEVTSSPYPFFFFLFFFKTTKAAQPKADKYPTTNFSPFNCCLNVFLPFRRGRNTPKIGLLGFVTINSFPFYLLCVWVLFKSLDVISVSEFLLEEEEEEVEEEEERPTE